MKKINYKGRCEKRKVSKCKDICRTYSKIQSVMVDMLQSNVQNSSESAYEAAVAERVVSRIMDGVFDGTISGDTDKADFYTELSENSTALIQIRNSIIQRIKNLLLAG